MNDKTRRTLRTTLQVLLALAVAAPVLVDQLGLDTTALPWLGTVLVAAALVTRVSQIDAVEQFLQGVLGGSLAATPPEAGDPPA